MRVTAPSSRRILVTGLFVTTVAGSLLGCSGGSGVSGAPATSSVSVASTATPDATSPAASTASGANGTQSATKPETQSAGAASAASQASKLAESASASSNADRGRPLAGLTIGVDPGHNGANAAHPEIINHLIDAGFGQRKPCNTTGTSTNAGYSEHAFNWDVASRLTSDLTALGAKVVMTRSNDTGVGPCIDKRAAIMNGAKPAVVISIHADGNYSATARGFHVIYAPKSVGGSKTVSQSKTLAQVVADSLARSSGMPRSNYIGGGTGVVTRTDLACTNLAEVPTVLIESGNMRQTADVALLTSASFRQKEADAITAAIRTFLHK